MNILKKYLPSITSILTIIFLLWLPYYIYEGRFFVGGDDTKLMYIFPDEYIKNMAFFSWSHISSVGSFNPNQHAIPLLSLLSVIIHFTHSRLFVDYLVFSTPLIMGFFSFQLLIKEIDPSSHFFERYIGSLFYSLSPILIIDQLSIFLYSVWLIGLIPWLSYCLLRYLKHGRFINVFGAVIVSLIFSIGFYSIPWSFAFLLPLIITLVIVRVFYKKEDIKLFLNRSVIFIAAIVFSHAFWLFPFISTFLLKSSSNIGSKVLSSEVASTFRSTVFSTATGNALFPLLNLFHRQIAIDFDWQLKKTFFNFYDHTFWLNSIFIIVITWSLLKFRTIKKGNYKKIYIILLITFLLSLFFFTVNLGPLKEIFFALGYIPGFVIFRNFYDKFSIAYVFFYSLFFTISLSLILEHKKILRKIVLSLVFFIILVNTYPIKDIADSPLWTTKNSLRSIHYPQEYIDFISDIKKKVDPSTTVLSLPLNIAAYSILPEIGSQNVYAGTSPFNILSGINDFSGDMSFTSVDTGKINDFLLARNYEEINFLLEKYNINYILVTKNIPKQVQNSYLFANGYKLKMQDSEFLESIEGKLVVKSKNGNYELYTTKSKHFLLESKNISFRKVSPVHYELVLHNVKESQALYFKDSFHPGWKLFMEPYENVCKDSLEVIHSMSECRALNRNFNINDLSYSFRKPIFDNTHVMIEQFSNKWLIEPKFVKENYSNHYFKTNSDGTIDIKLSLYFAPQLIFYYGVIVSFVTIICLTIFTFYDYKRKK